MFLLFQNFLELKYIKFNSCFLRLGLIIFTSISLFSLLFDKSKADNLLQLKSLSYQCFQSRNIQICSAALQKIEKYQLLTGLNENYKCQTRLLGLQSKLIMAMFKLNKGRFYTENLDGLEETCRTSHSTQYK